jgi:hypothetical protein
MSRDGDPATWADRLDIVRRIVDARRDPEIRPIEQKYRGLLRSRDAAKLIP